MVAKENEEIDRIMKEIEDLEKKMDDKPKDSGLAPKVEANAIAPEENTTTPIESSTTSAVDAEPISSPEPQESSEAPSVFDAAVATAEEDLQAEVTPDEAIAPSEPETSKVIPMTRKSEISSTQSQESSTTPSSGSNGGLSLRIGGCEEVALEFTRSGITVSLSCSDEGLVISTDQGAEFRVPFRRIA